jgi:hypothetical protein
VPKIVQTVRKPTPIPDAPEHPIGSMRPGKHLTSKLEEQVRAKLTAAGVELVAERHGIQCGFDEVRKKYPVLTPDFIVAGAQVCLEVDPETRTRPGGPGSWPR